MAGFQSQSGGVEKIRGLLAWCKETTRNYENVTVTNMTSSWKDGLAFCAIIHRFRPDLINYAGLKAGDVLENNRLAFSVAEEELGIPALLDPEDMVQMAVPDRLCVITYVSQLHAHFKDCQPDNGLVASDKKEAIGRNWRDKAGLKRPSAIPYFPVPRPTKKRGTLEDICTICRKKVYILERSLVEGKLYHRVCYKESVNKKEGDGDAKSSTRNSSIGAVPETGVVFTKNESPKRSPGTSISSSSPSSSSTARESKSPSSSPNRLSQSKSPSRSTSSSAEGATTPTSVVVDGTVTTPQPRPKAMPRLTTTTTTTTTKEAMSKFLEYDNDRKKPPIPATRTIVPKKSEVEDTKPASNLALDRILPATVAPSARAVGARINRLMAEQNNNEFGVETKLSVGTEERTANSCDVSQPPNDRQPKYLGLDNVDREVNAAKTEESKSSNTKAIEKDKEKILPNSKPIPALRRIEPGPFEEVGEKEKEENEARLNSRLASSIERVSGKEGEESEAGADSLLTPSKVVSKGTLERKLPGARTGKPTLFVKPMIKPQIASHRRVYLAHFDVDGNVDVRTEQNWISDRRSRAADGSSVSQSGSSDCNTQGSSIDTENASSDAAPTKPLAAIRSSVIKDTSCQPPTISALPPSLRNTTTPTKSYSAYTSLASNQNTFSAATTTSSPSSKGVQSAERNKQLKISLPEPDSASKDKTEKLSPSNPFYEGDVGNEEEEEEECSGKEGEPEEETRKSNLASDNTREEDVLTPTNPFSDGFDDDDDHFVKSLEISADGPTTSAADRSMASTPTLFVISTNGISSSTDSVDEQNPKCPPLKPPRILLRSEADSNDDDSIAETHSPKRILSVDKSLLADLKVPLHGSDRKSLVSSVSGEDVSKSSRNSSPSSVMGSESGSSPCRRKTKRKAPPPPSEFQARVIRSASVTIALDAIEDELQSIDEEQQDLEEKGVALETKLRAEDAEEDETAMEAIWAEWFQLVNRKNELFRRGMELYHTRRMQELEDKHSEVERDIRILGNIPLEKKTPKDLEREEWLIGELIAIVNERNKVVDAVEMDRQREKAEDESIELMRERRLTIAANQQNKGTDTKKTKEDKKREKKEKKKAEKQRKKEEKGINKPSKGFGLTFKRKVLAD